MPASRRSKSISDSRAPSISNDGAPITRAASRAYQAALDSALAASIATSTNSHAHKKPEGHIPRPPNAFMIFRAELQKSSTVPLEIKRNQSRASEVAGEAWRRLPTEERERYMTLAEKAKEEHQRKYPTYQYKPQLNRMKLIRRPNSSSKRELKVNSRVVDKVLAEKRVDPVDELTNDVNARLKLDGGRPSTTRTDRKNAHLRNPKLTRKPKPVIVPSVDPVPSLEIDSAPSSTDSSFESIQDALGPWNVEPAVVSAEDNDYSTFTRTDSYLAQNFYYASTSNLGRHNTSADEKTSPLLPPIDWTSNSSYAGLSSSYSTSGPSRVKGWVVGDEAEEDAKVLDPDEVFDVGYFQ